MAVLSDLTEPPPTLEQQFRNFAKYGDESADGKSITLTNSDKWLKQATILDNINLTLTDTGYCFSKFKAYSIKYDDYLRYLDDLAKYKNMDLDDMKNKLVNCGLPGEKKDKKDKKRKFM